MPRKAGNTERGSRVLREKRKRERKWESLLLFKAARPALSLRSLALSHYVSVRELQRRWKRHEAAMAAGDPAPATTASSDRRGGHNRAFSTEQEQLLHALVERATPA